MKILLTGIIALLISISSIAQNSHSKVSKEKELHHQKQRVNGSEVFNKLDLTDDQKAQVKTLNENFKQQMQDLHKDTSLSAGDFKDKRMALIKEQKEKVNAILTPAQRKQMDDLEHEFAKGKKGEKQGGRFDEMTKNLNLTPEQSAKMKDLSAELKNSMQSIHENTTLSKDEKKEQMQSLMKKHKTDMENLLTDEQKEQMKTNTKNRRSEAI